MTRTTITLPQDLIAELMSLVNARSKTEAVINAIKDEIRLRKLERIKSFAGTLEFTTEAEELRHGDHRLG
jgi:metal-responsive CopG/Arc/MetJ family transcriptional regulator